MLKPKIDIITFQNIKTCLYVLQDSETIDCYGIECDNCVYGGDVTCKLVKAANLLDDILGGMGFMNIFEEMNVIIDDFFSGIYVEKEGEDEEI